MNTVAILSTRPTLLHLPPRVVTDKNGEGKDRPRVLGTISLTPGSAKQPVATMVQREEWDRAKAHPAVKQWLSLGWIREKPPEVQAPTETPPPADLQGYQGPAAIGMVETETNEAALRTWLAAEGRQPVRDAINKRLTAIAQPAAKPIINRR